MKCRIKILSFLIIGIVLVLSNACKKSETEEQTTGYFFKCKVNGASFEVTKHMSDIDAGGANIGGEQTVNSKTSSINLYAANIATKGATTYTPSSQYDVTFRDENGVTWNFNSGNFAITSFDAAKSEARGSFSSITVKSNNNTTLTLTEGSFYVYLIK